MIHCLTYVVIFVDERRFFEPLKSQMDMLAEASRLLLDGARKGPEGMEQSAGLIDALRDRLLQLEASLVTDVQRTLLTPIDPEDILRISSLMRRALAGVAKSASRHLSCECQPPPAEWIAQLEIIHQCSLTLKSAFASFRNGAIAKHCNQIHELKARADEIARDARQRLFTSDLGPVAVIRLSEVFNLTEAVLNRYTVASETLKRIKLKNA